VQGYQPRIKLDGACRFTASLRVRHPSLDPRLIATALSLPPERSRKLGDRRRTPKGNLLPGYEKESSCHFRAVAEATTAEEFIATVDRFLDRLAPAGQFLRSIRAGGGRSDLFVGWFFGVSSACRSTTAGWRSSASWRSTWASTFTEATRRTSEQCRSSSKRTAA
jgi:hypothetical protein